VVVQGHAAVVFAVVPMMMVPFIIHLWRQDDSLIIILPVLVRVPATAVLSLLPTSHIILPVPFMPMLVAAVAAFMMVHFLLLFAVLAFAHGVDWHYIDVALVP
jgi:hypothetical protein